jgi:2,4-dienoyl-CoA reductase-like NADH-dependent reductase (Old Yellow Enzyme family)
VSPFQNALERRCIPGLQRLTAAVHEHGAKIAVQLFHGGREARFLKSLGMLPVSPSVVKADPYYKGEHRALTEDEIHETIHAFGEGAAVAGESGFDAVQVHGAHAYLLSQFLSPSTNLRDDMWGGPLENRLRFHRMVYENIRNAVGRDFPVLIKIGVADGFPGGLEFSEGKEAAVRLAESGFDALEISQGLRGEKYEGTEFRAGIDRMEKEAYFRDWCRKIKKEVRVPVMMVGGLRSFGLMEQIVRNGEADFISLSRPLIREPDLINIWKSQTHKHPECVSCNRCLEALYKGDHLHCALLKEK